MQDIHIDQIKEEDYLEVIELWEQSVKASHSFVTEEYRKELKQLILKHYLPNSPIHIIRSKQGEILAFMGVDGEMIDALFVHPDWFGKGLGGYFTDYAINELGTKLVDVNEENPKATAFYKKKGFEVFDRSTLDGQGRPHPILHMRLAT